MYNEGEPTYIISTPKNNSNVVFAMNYLYNPEATLPDALMFGTPQKSFLSRVVSLEQDLSEKDETMLGWTKEFKDSIAERKQTLIDINS
jgi:hypothetical protein